MDQIKRDRLDSLRSERERSNQNRDLQEKLNKELHFDEFSFLSFEESVFIRGQGKSWPSNKWHDNLFIQTRIDQPFPIADALNKYVRINNHDYCYLLFSNYNFCLVKIANHILLRLWANFINIDGDQIFCYIPGRTDYICIEKTEDSIVSFNSSERQWIYEITFSDIQLKQELE